MKTELQAKDAALQKALEDARTWKRRCVNLRRALKQAMENAAARREGSHR